MKKPNLRFLGIHLDLQSDAIVLRLCTSGSGQLRDVPLTPRELARLLEHAAGILARTLPPDPTP